MRPSWIITDKYHERKQFSWWNVFHDMCRIGRWSYWSWFDVDMRENEFYIFVPSDLDLWPLDFKFVPIVTLVQRYVSNKWKLSTAFLFRENRMQRTDGQTDGRSATFSAPPREGPIINACETSRRNLASSKIRSLPWHRAGCEGWMSICSRQECWRKWHSLT